MSRHRPFGSAGLHGAITGEPQLYLHDPIYPARPASSRTDVWPASTRRRAFGRFVARVLHHLNRSSGSEPAIRNAGPSAPGFAP